MNRFKTRKRPPAKHAKTNRKQSHRRARLEPLESRHLLSSGSWGITEGGLYHDLGVDIGYAPDGSGLYSLSLIQNEEGGAFDLQLGKRAADGQQVFSQTILNNMLPQQNTSPSTNQSHLLVSAAGDIYVAAEYRAGADPDLSVAGDELPVYGGSDIFVARYSAAAGTPQLVWSESFGSAEDEELAAISFIDSGSGEPDLCLVGAFGQTLALWDGSQLPNTTGADDGMFVVRATGEGSLQLADELHDAGMVFLDDAEVGASGELYVTGYFVNERIDVQIGDAIFPRTAHQIEKALVAKYRFGETAIEPLWAHQIADPDFYSYGHSIVVAGDGGEESVLVGGIFRSEADFGITSLVKDGYWEPDGFVVQVAENESGVPENKWVRHLGSEGHLLPTDLNLVEGTDPSASILYVGGGFGLSADFAPATPTLGKRVARGYSDMFVAEIGLDLDAAGVVQGDTLGRIWQMELADDDAVGPGGSPRVHVAMDVADGRLAVATSSSSAALVTPVGTLESNGGWEAVLLDIASEYPAVELTLSEPVVGASETELIARAVDRQTNADLVWQRWELWQTGESEPAQDSDTYDDGDGDPTRLTLREPLELGSNYEVVVHVADAAGNATVYPFSFQAVLDPPTNLTAAAKPNSTKLTWDLPESSIGRDGFVIESLTPNSIPSQQVWGYTGPNTTSCSLSVGDSRRGLRFRVRSFSGTPDAVQLLSPADWLIVAQQDDPSGEPTPPAINSLSAAPNPVVQGADVTLTANGVTDDSAVSKVDFFHDQNANGVLDLGSDALIGQDTDGANGWSATTAAAYGLGTEQFFAVATDDEGLTSNVAETAVAIVDASNQLHFASVDVPLAIADPHPKKGVRVASSQIDVSGTGDTVDKVSVLVAIDHAAASDLSVVLTRDAGNPIDLIYASGTWALTDSSAFVGEPLDATWTLSITDSARDRVTGMLTGWSLIVTPTAASGAMSNALSAFALAGTSTAVADGVAILSDIESPRVRSTEDTPLTDQPHLWVQSETRASKPSIAVGHSRRAHWNGPPAETIDLALAELEESLLDDKLARLLAANWT